MNTSFSMNPHLLLNLNYILILFFNWLIVSSHRVAVLLIEQLFSINIYIILKPMLFYQPFIQVNHIRVKNGSSIRENIDIEKFAAI